MLTKTIAIITGEEAYPQILLKALSELKLQLLFVSPDSEAKRRLLRQLAKFDMMAELAFISCERDGCWQADVILLYETSNLSTKVVERIREVATQKTILVIYQGYPKKMCHGLKELLPNSRVIEVELATLRDGGLNTYFPSVNPIGLL